MMTAPHWARILQHEVRMGHERVLTASWLNWEDWHTDTIITRDGDYRIRLVLLTAMNPGHGALSRLIEGIEMSGLMPVLVEPSIELQKWCQKRNWRERTIGHGDDTHRVWYPRRWFKEEGYGK